MYFANTYSCTRRARAFSFLFSFFLFFFLYWEFVQIFKGRLERSHGGSDLIPFIKQRERDGEGEREAACVLACLNVKIAHAIISDEKVATEWICFNIADMEYHIRRDGGEGGVDFFAFAHTVERP